ncbi:hypothetical protein [Polaromonas sp. UC242_47]|uniref:hypothetical protein n=1 Tax=Polaromonas sp. UC242_47 TaxID=3374626 RepID=UPI0037B49EB4
MQPGRRMGQAQAVLLELRHNLAGHLVAHAAGQHHTGAVVPDAGEGVAQAGRCAVGFQRQMLDLAAAYAAA